MQYQLDVRKYRCPLPVLMTKQALQSLAFDDELQVFINQESALSDFALLCENLHCVYQLKQVNQQTTMIIRKVEQN